MSGAEIAWRARERLRCHADRFKACGNPESEHDRELDELLLRHGSSIKSYFLQGPARRFYPSTQDRKGTARIFLDQYPKWFERAVRQAQMLCEHQVDLAGHHNIDLGEDIDWHRDPVSGFRWPLRYWADYDLVAAPPADAKIVHELNRHQHLPRLAKTYFLTGDEVYAAEAIAQVESWIRQNPKWQGVNWQSSLEIAIRSLSWLWMLFLLLSSASLDETRLYRICRSLFAQLDHIYRYPSVYASPNTHLIGEAAALFIAGILFEELPRAARWRKFGWRTLEKEMERQVSGDGVHRELSSYYHCYAADFYLHALTLARWNHIPLPEWLYGRLSKMFDFVMHITRSDGSIPLLGDDDGGRAIALGATSYGSYRDGLCSASVLFGRPDFKYQAGGFHEESLWLLGDEAPSIFSCLPKQLPSDLCCSFDDAGYFIQRSGWDTAATQVIFDCGGLGLASGGHGHADALSFTVFSGGHELLIDPGTGVYNAAPEWRGFFRSTAAHNTVLVDGQGQSEPGSTFRWKTRASGRLLNRITLAEAEYLDAIVALPQSVMHRRRLIQIRPDYWIVLDELRGTGEHEFDFLYHFASDVQLTVLSDERRGEIDCRAQIDTAALHLCLYTSHPVRASVVCGRRAPIQGWASRAYGERRASPVLKARIHGTAPLVMMSFVIPGGEPAHSCRFKANSPHTIAAAIRDGDYRDIAVVAVEDGDLRFMEYAMRGEFFWLRTEGGGLRRLLAVNAYSFSYAGQTVFESLQPIPYLQVSFWENGMLIEDGQTLSLRERTVRDAA
jgi:hypothetical protein